MFTIKTLNNISDIIYKALPADKFSVNDSAENPDAILVRSADMNDMAMPSNLLAIARAGAGTNNIPCAECAQSGIVVFNTPGANANAVKELVICGMLLSCRKIIPGEAWIRNLKASGESGIEKLAEKGKKQFVGPEIKGKTLGVIGLGAIGRLVAQAAVSLGMSVVGYDPFFNGELGGVNVTADLDELFSKSDFITLHVPLNNDTKYMICKETISKMPKGSVILNFSRGGLVNDNDIIEALENGALSCYVTDFASDALVGIDGVIAFPHLGASTPESEENCAQMASEELYEFLVNGNIINSVNMPSLFAERSSGTRITVISKDGDPITFEGNPTVKSASKGGYTYTIADFVCSADKTALKSNGAIKVRVL